MSKIEHNRFDRSPEEIERLEGNIRDLCETIITCGITEVKAGQKINFTKIILTATSSIKMILDNVDQNLTTFAKNNPQASEDIAGILGVLHNKIFPQMYMEIDVRQEQDYVT